MTDNSINGGEGLAGVISFPFCIGDFLKDTMHLDTLEIGVYLKLLIAHYQSGDKGLPYDDKKLARISGVSAKVWTRVKPTVLEYFYIENDVILHKRVLEVLRKVHDISSKQRAKALKRHNSSHATAQPQQCQSKSKSKVVSTIYSGKDKIFKKPTVEEIIEYCSVRNNTISPEYFYDYYEARDWKLKKDKMKDWKACVRTWEKNNVNKKGSNQDAKRDIYEWAME